MTDVSASPADTKPALKSKTVWGGILAAASGAVAAYGAPLLTAFGVDAGVADTVAKSMAGILAAVASILTIVGRASASLPLA